MTRARKTLISLATTEYYHCVSRCVRRAFLCGDDAVSGVCYEHRRQWLENRLLFLAQYFAIDIAAYAIMSNHYHIVLHVDRSKAQGWSNAEVVRRWHGVFSGTMLSKQFLDGEVLDEGQMLALCKLIACWRERLMDISWFMRSVNQTIACQANKEDKVSGRFWEGRFKSQALLDESALLACMVYVDLNPIRAQMATTPETSDHTSIQRRIRDWLNGNKINPCHRLMPFTVESQSESNTPSLPLSLPAYMELVDQTGRIMREDKHGAIDGASLPILERLHISSENWMYLAWNFHSPFRNLVGGYYRIKQACQLMGQTRAHGSAACRQYFGQT